MPSLHTLTEEGTHIGERMRERQRGAKEEFRVHTLKGISLSEQCNLSVQRPLHVSPATTTTATRRSERRRNNKKNSDASSKGGSGSAHQQQEEDARIYVHISPRAVYTVRAEGGKTRKGSRRQMWQVCQRVQARGSARGSCPRAMLKNVINVFLSR